MLLYVLYNENKLFSISSTRQPIKETPDAADDGTITDLECCSFAAGGVVNLALPLYETYILLYNAYTKLVYGALF
jgi:hypothetical protein